MILKSGIIEDQTLFSSNKKLNSFFVLMEQIRNQIAHSDSILKYLRIPKNLVAFIAQLENLKLFLSQR